MRFKSYNVAYFLILPTLLFSNIGLTSTLNLDFCNKILSFKDPLQKLDEEKKDYFDHDTAEDYPYTETPSFLARVRPVPDPQEGFLSKIMMIRQAKHTIDMSTYIFKTDDTGYTVLHELREAVKRGVVVRLMIDPLGSINPKNLVHTELKALLATEGGVIKDENGAELHETDDDGKDILDSEGHPVKLRARAEVVIFNPLVNVAARLKSFTSDFEIDFGVGDTKMDVMRRWFNRRSHDKILLIDGDYDDLAVAIVGGRNIADHYYGFPKPNPETFNDMEVIVRNAPNTPQDSKLKNSLLAHYDRLYYHLGNKWLNNDFLGFKRTYPTQLSNMETASNRLLSPESPATKKLADMESQGYLEADSPLTNFSVSHVKVVNEIENITRRHAILDPEGKINRVNPDSITGNLRKMVLTAKKSIVFVSPYFYLSPPEIARLQDWLDGDSTRTLTIISNSISSTDNMPAQALVDRVLIPGFLASHWKPKNPDQIRIFAFGKLDGVEYGGKAFYGKLHAKYAVVDDEISIITTSNGDPRSRHLNSEVGFLMQGADLNRQLLLNIKDLESRSYRAYSPEWYELRAKSSNALKVKLQPYILKFITLTEIRDLI